MVASSFCDDGKSTLKLGTQTNACIVNPARHSQAQRLPMKQLSLKVASKPGNLGTIKDIDRPARSQGTVSKALHGKPCQAQIRQENQNNI